ncbi:murein transglycosylase A [Prosthecomicrobium sp. N25]|uniref:murein transglycosylase A n=1 Tax=Prosthecomicrobium sp. N25 TaxID=3129254 RepID=UPI003077272C
MTAAASLEPLAFADLPGWAEDRHAEAMAAFRLTARHIAGAAPKSRTLADAAFGPAGVDGEALARVARRLLAENPEGDAACRRFFETSFAPFRVRPTEGRPFLTGYYEPEVEGSPVRTGRFAVPLLARPDDLVDVNDRNRPAGMDPSFAFARRAPDGLVPYFDRAEIEDGALAGRGLELVWLESPVDAFFIHVQGSARIRLPGRDPLRVAYDGKAGWPYTSIGRRLVERGVAPAEAMTADRLRAWLEADPAAGRALMRENRSYIFFKVLDGLDPALGAVAAAGVQLTPGRSLAVDRRLHTFGTPVFLDADLPFGPGGALAPVRRLMVAQDTGSAIVGPARGDVFVGCGPEAGVLAGYVRHEPRSFVVLVPRD